MDTVTQLLTLTRRAPTLDNYITTLAPLFWRKFNETSGTAGTNYGSLGGTTTWTPGTGGALGQAGHRGANQAYDFDGTTSLDSFANNASMANAETHTIAILAKAAGAGESSTGVLTAYGTLSGEYSVRFASSARAIAARVHYVTTNATSLTNETLDTGVWYWIFVTYDVTGDRKAYITLSQNGVATPATYATQIASVGSYNAPSAAFAIGALTNNASTWDGYIDEVLFFNYVLTTAQMQKIIDYSNTAVYLAGPGTANVAAATGVAATDTAAIQAAINGLPHPAGGTVYLDPGDTYVVNKLLIPKNVTLKTADGQTRATLQAANALNDNMIRNHYPNVGDDNIIIENIIFEGNSANQTDLVNPCHGVGFYNVSNSAIRNCEFNDFELDGVYLGKDGTINSIPVNGANSNITIEDCDFADIRRNGISVTRANNVRILNSTFTDCNKGVPDNSGYLAGAVDLEPNEVTDDCEDIEIAYCTFDSQYAPSIQLAGSASKQRVNIHDNTIAQAGAYKAIAVYTPVTDTDITDNVITAAADGGIWVNGQSLDIPDMTVSGNTVTGTDTANTVGIGFNYVQTGVMDDNHIIDFAKAILVFASDTITVSNNEMTSCAAGIDVTGGSTNVTQSGNVSN